MSQIERVGVVGCGLMGSGIAEVCARAGLDVLVREVNQGALDAGRKRIEGSLNRAVRSGKLPEADCNEALRPAFMPPVSFTLAVTRTAKPLSSQRTYFA